MYDKAEHDCKSKGHECSIGEDILAQNFWGGPKWLEATIVERMGPASYKTQIGEQVWKQHVDQMCNKSYNHTPETSVNEPKLLVLNKSYEIPKPEHSLKHSKARERDREPGESPYNSMSNSDSTNTPLNADQSNQPPQPAHYPSRKHKPPSHLGYNK